LKTLIQPIRAELVCDRLFCIGYESGPVGLGRYLVNSQCPNCGGNMMTPRQYVPYAKLARVNRVIGWINWAWNALYRAWRWAVPAKKTDPLADDAWETW